MGWEDMSVKCKPGMAHVWKTRLVCDNCGYVNKAGMVPADGGTVEIRKDFDSEETKYEYVDGTIAYQRKCDYPGCCRGLLLAPVRDCPKCQGTGFFVRWENVSEGLEPR